MRPLIEVERIGKRFRTWRRASVHNTLRDTIASTAAGLLRSSRRANGNGASHSFWALREVSFRVQPGEALGIIGPNGAGKSTLLKILAQITEPTEGVGRVRGRVGSLLEVGTGFHSELTGRENIFLSGAILGMNRADIVRKFDEIVDFAEVDQFVDTPVKHYSSGMYLRLAFAVVAHLDPDILIVDEVLAVGDERFQRKCIAKMEEVCRHSGRTVLFVSHNLAAVQGLCERAVLLEHGRLLQDGLAPEVIAEYLRSLGSSSSVAGQSVDVSALSRRGTGTARFAAVEYGSDEPLIAFQPYSDGPLNFRLRLFAERRICVAGLAVTIHDPTGTILVNANAYELGWRMELEAGDNLIVLKIRALHLKPGSYTVGLWLEEEDGPVLDHITRAFTLQVLAPPGKERSRPSTDGGAVSCELEITTEAIDLPSVDMQSGSPR
jgi:lipopolysaccharide transport system ATP-binding protein